MSLRKLGGSSRTSPADTAKTDQPASPRPMKAPSQWISKIGSFEESPQSLNAKFLPVKMIAFDPENPRELIIGPQEITAGPKISHDERGDSWQEKYQSDLKDFYRAEKSEIAHRKIDEHMGVARLAVSIGSPEKLLNPVTVYRDSTQVFRLLAGERRTLAHLLMGAEKIAAIVLEKEPDSLDKARLQWEENNSQESLRFSDKIKNLFRIIDVWTQESGQSISVRKLTGLVSIKRMTATGVVKLYKERDADIVAAIREGHIDNFYLLRSIIMLEEDEKKDYLSDLKRGKQISGKAIEAHHRKMKEIKFDGDAVVKPTAPAKAGVVSKITISDDGDFAALKSIIGSAIRDEEFKEKHAIFGEVNTYSKEELTAIWKRVKKSLTSEVET